MCKNPPITLIVAIVMLFVTSSCYEKVDDFHVSNSEFVVRHEHDTTVLIKTNGYNRINGIIVNDGVRIYFIYPEKVYAIDGLSDTVHVEYFQKRPLADIASIKSVKTSFFSIANLSDDDQDQQPMYKIMVERNRSTKIQSITVLLISKTAERKIFFNFR